MRKIIYSLFLSSVFIISHAQIPVSRYFGNGELTCDLITEICQDADGFIWIGTINGLNRYDGWSFNHIYTGESSKGRLRSNYIYELFPDSHGRLWVGTNLGLQLYDRNDKEISNTKYSTSSQGLWMNTHCWEYGLIFRFPLDQWPLDTSTDKSFITGISGQHNLYRYVGKPHAELMHYLDFCLEEYIQYLETHPHIAFFEDGRLKYEVYRQVVGEDDSFQLVLTSRARSYLSSLDNMGGVVTVFEY